MLARDLTTIEREKERLSHELHDGLGPASDRHRVPREGARQPSRRPQRARDARRAADRGAHQPGDLEHAGARARPSARRSGRQRVRGRAVGAGARRVDDLRDPVRIQRRRHDPGREPHGGPSSVPDRAGSRAQCGQAWRRRQDHGRSARRERQDHPDGRESRHARGGGRGRRRHRHCEHAQSGEAAQCAARHQAGGEGGVRSASLSTRKRHRRCANKGMPYERCNIHDQSAAGQGSHPDRRRPRDRSARHRATRQSGARPRRLPRGRRCGLGAGRVARHDGRPRDRGHLAAGHVGHRTGQADPRHRSRSCRCSS